MKDPATWKDMAYLVLMLPIGIAEFTISVVAWSVGLYLTFLPMYWTWIPDDWQVVLWNHPLVNIDSWVGTLPFAGLGVLLLALAVIVTKAPRHDPRRVRPRHARPEPAPHREAGGPLDGGRHRLDQRVAERRHEDVRPGDPMTSRSRSEAPLYLVQPEIGPDRGRGGC